MTAVVFLFEGFAVPYAQANNNVSKASAVNYVSEINHDYVRRLESLKISDDPAFNQQINRIIDLIQNRFHFSRPIEKQDHYEMSGYYKGESSRVSFTVIYQKHLNSSPEQIAIKIDQNFYSDWKAAVDTLRKETRLISFSAQQSFALEFKAAGEAPEGSRLSNIIIHSNNNLKEKSTNELESMANLAQGLHQFVNQFINELVQLGVQGIETVIKAADPVDYLDQLVSLTTVFQEGTPSALKSGLTVFQKLIRQLPSNLFEDYSLLRSVDFALDDLIQDLETNNGLSKNSSDAILNVIHFLNGLIPAELTTTNYLDLESTTRAVTKLNRELNERFKLGLVEFDVKSVESIGTAVRYTIHVVNGPEVQILVRIGKRSFQTQDGRFAGATWRYIGEADEHELNYEIIAGSNKELFKKLAEEFNEILADALVVFRTGQDIENVKKQTSQSDWDKLWFWQRSKAQESYEKKAADSVAKIQQIEQFRKIFRKAEVQRIQTLFRVFDDLEISYAQGLEQVIEQYLETYDSKRKVDFSPSQQKQKILQMEVKRLRLAVLYASAAALVVPIAAQDLYRTIWDSIQPLFNQRGTSGLYASFDTTDPYLSTFSSTYDNALVAIAAVWSGVPQTARDILDRFQTEFDSLGKIYVSHFPDMQGTWFAPKEYVERVGDASFFGMAMFHYEMKTGDTRYHSTIVALADHLLQYQQSDGRFLGGTNYDGSNFTWASTEHNMDARSFYNMVYQLTGEQKYFDAHYKVTDWLTTSAWNSSEQRFNRGEADTAFATDTHSWGIQSSNDAFTLDQMQAMTGYVETQANVTWQGTNGTDGFDYTNRHEAISYEWTAEMALAYLVVGQTAKYQEIMTALEDQFINQNETILYVNKIIDTTHGWTAYPYPSMASMMQYFMAKTGLNFFSLNGALNMTLPIPPISTSGTTGSSTTGERSDSGLSRADLIGIIIGITVCVSPILFGGLYFYCQSKRYWATHKEDPRRANDVEPSHWDNDAELSNWDNNAILKHLWPAKLVESARAWVTDAESLVVLHTALYSIVHGLEKFSMEDAKDAITKNVLELAKNPAKAGEFYVQVVQWIQNVSGLTEFQNAFNKAWNLVTEAFTQLHQGYTTETVREEIRKLTQNMGKEFTDALKETQTIDSAVSAVTNLHRSFNGLSDTSAPQWFVNSNDTVDLKQIRKLAGGRPGLELTDTSILTLNLSEVKQVTPQLQTLAQAIRKVQEHAAQVENRRLDLAVIQGESPVSGEELGLTPKWTVKNTNELHDVLPPDYVVVMINAFTGAIQVSGNKAEAWYQSLSESGKAGVQRLGHTFIVPELNLQIKEIERLESEISERLITLVQQ